MIKEEVLKENGNILQIRSNGHAGSAAYGKDLICAGVSSILYGTANALDQMTGDSDLIEISDDGMNIRISDSDQTKQIILNTCLIQLQTVEERFGKNIKIKITEV